MLIGPIGARCRAAPFGRPLCRNLVGTRGRGLANGEGGNRPDGDFADRTRKRRANERAAMERRFLFLGLRGALGIRRGRRCGQRGRLIRGGASRRLARSGRSQHAARRGHQRGGRRRRRRRRRGGRSCGGRWRVFTSVAGGNPLAAGGGAAGVLAASLARGWTCGGCSGTSPGCGGCRSGGWCRDRGPLG